MTRTVTILHETRTPVRFRLFVIYYNVNETIVKRFKYYLRRNANQLYIFVTRRILYYVIRRVRVRLVLNFKDGN